MNIKSLAARLALAAIATHAGVLAQASDASSLYAPCVVCHQPSAGGSADGVIPNLAGQDKAYLERQLAHFRAGARSDPAMDIVAAHPNFGTPQTSKLLASYLSALEPNAKPVVGAGDRLRLGQETFTHICAACHGPDGSGSRDNRAPRIGKQHYPYVREQIEDAAQLHKELAPPEMTSALRGMSPQEKDAVADYISRLGNSDPSQ